MRVRRLAAAAIGTALALSVGLGATAAAAGEGDVCCPLEIFWHPYAGAYFADAQRSLAARRTRARLDRAMAAATATWRAHGICLQWTPGGTLSVPAGLKLFGPDDPTPASLEAQLPVGAGPAVVFVERLEALDPQRKVYIRARGATPRAGAPLAIVSLEDRAALKSTLENELYHLLGLRDAELGASDAEARHVVQPAMWSFLQRACAVAGDRPALAALIAAKDRCVAAATGKDASGCYRGRDAGAGG
jgi:hypothetical protein